MMRKINIISNNLIRPKKMLKIETGLNRTLVPAFITGGIGDIIAIESFYSYKEKKSINSFFYATRKYNYIKELMTLLPFYKLIPHISLWEDFENFWAFHSLGEYLEYSQTKDLIVASSTDLSISSVFWKVKHNQAKYCGSSFLNYKLAEIEKFKLPYNYVVITPFSTDKRIGTRDFSYEDWIESIKILEKYNLYGVILNHGNDTPMFHHRLINLCNKTTIGESIEILKSSRGYVGIDSWLSVLAAKLMDKPILQIKSNNSHAYDNAECYFAPHRDFPFLLNNIKCN